MSPPGGVTATRRKESTASRGMWGCGWELSLSFLRPHSLNEVGGGRLEMVL